MNTTRLMRAVERVLRNMNKVRISPEEAELRSALTEAKEAPMIIVINAQSFPTLVDMNGHEFPNVLVIDWTMQQEGGDCPVCGREQMPDTTCDHCGLNSWDPNNLQRRAINAAIALWRKGSKQS